MSKVLFKYILFSVLVLKFAHASLLINYRYQPRLEERGVDSIGYPQVCIRTNTYDAKLDFDGIFKEIAQKHPANELLNEANKYAASGDFGHSWTILFNSPDKWTSWSYRFPISGDIFKSSPLQKNHWADSPSRKFSYQYCVNVKNRDTSVTTVENKYIPEIDATSRDIAGKIYPGVPLSPTQGVYTMATPCVWFAGQIFQKLTGKTVGFEQPFDWKLVADETNQPTLAVLKSMPDAGVVAEFITRKIKFSGGLEGSNPEKVIFTADRNYVLYNNNQILNIAPIENNSYFKTLAADFESIQAGMHHNELIYLFMRSGNISVFDLNKKQFIKKEVSPDSLFSGNPASIKDIPFKDIRTILPAYGNYTNTQWILLRDMRLLEVNFDTKRVTLRDINNSPFSGIVNNLPFNVNEIIAGTNSGGARTLFLTNRRYADLDSSFRVIDKVKKLEEHPIFGRYFAVQ
ncbi:MAG: hypothetical protein K2X04_08930 [Burkholderiales bacterium]|nr:hypothetical protein [Burkholderiales bacterium]